MALTVTTTGRVDVPSLQIGNVGQPKKLSLWVAQVTLGLATDYTTTPGIPMTSILTQLGISQVISCYAESVLVTGGTVVGGGLSSYNPTTNVFRYLVSFGAAGIQGSDYTATAADVFNLLIVGV